ncbi:Uncharacterized conserved protein YdeI, YjbR/CyaY-like superfamily, DUF1801 family [Marivirga sericea]|uniref:Uncharacterized conserved protein YdeI, YjbR/CyaY-like superfamily, DUF1801 family n=1 Tax=Marivirga sericea TaxID=1028 RepID=A0A1X7KEF3_9BACT|nr:DUF1801 domain-containing protein [Marivirga sericea]SMG39654.1 Uncharacterized conserved protein YdeI, YjbR/CyaY-like superfamily, DUF1801 family [Marivirga sericea]
MGKSEKWHDELEFLRALINQTSLEKTRKWGGEVYTINNGNVLMIRAFKNHVGLWFYSGVYLKDPYEVLENVQKGKTKAMRHWKFAAINEMDAKKISKYIHEAIENEKNGIRWKAEKSDKVEIPILLEEAFESEEAFKIAFQELTPFKQKEFAEYIDTAKREATKISRLEKIKSMVHQGVGLNDQYRK